MSLQNNLPNNNQISETMNNETNVSTVSANNPSGATGKPKKNFKCTQARLYLICFLAVKYLRANLSSFTRFRPSYTPDFCDNIEKAINAAKSMKNTSERNFQTSKSRLALEAAAQVFLENWVSLKRYILTCFKESAAAQKVNLIAAGSVNYSKAAGNDWEALAKLIQSSVSYVNLERAVLERDNNMPDGFTDDFVKNATLCTDLLIAYKDETVNKGAQTISKLDANNAIYSTIISILADGQVIFKKNQAIKDSFIWSKLYDKVKSQSAASIRGYALDANGKGIKDVTVSVQKTEYSTTTNKDGYFEIGRLSGKAYMIELTKNGLTPVYEGVILKPGTTKHLKLTLQAAIVEQPVEMNTQQEAQAV